MNEKSWEARAVDEIIEEEYKTDYGRSTPSGLCPNCGTDVDSEIQSDDDDVALIVDYCRHCGWESDPYYE